MTHLWGGKRHVFPRRKLYQEWLEREPRTKWGASFRCQLRDGNRIMLESSGSFDFRFFPQAKRQRLWHLTLRPVVEKQIIAKAKAAGDGQSRSEL